MSEGWDTSAAAWIASLDQDFSRHGVLDVPMRARVKAGGYGRALDVGCGEGRFCRMMQAEGVASIGVDPTAELISVARARDPAGDYRIGRAERLDFADASFDLVVSYLSLIDIEGLEAAVAEMARVLRPGGAILAANLTSFNTAGGWRDEPGQPSRFEMDHYLESRAEWVAWKGIRVRNFHRPLSRYMQAFLAQGLRLTLFDEPAPAPDWPDQQLAARYRRAPWLVLMEWRKDQTG